MSYPQSRTEGNKQVCCADRQIFVSSKHAWIYKVSSRTARAVPQRNPILRNQTTKTTKQTKGQTEVEKLAHLLGLSSVSPLLDRSGPLLPTAHWVFPNQLAQRSPLFPDKPAAQPEVTALHCDFLPKRLQAVASRRSKLTRAPCLKRKNRTGGRGPGAVRRASFLPCTHEH